MTVGHTSAQIYTAGGTSQCLWGNSFCMEHCTRLPTMITRLLPISQEWVALDFWPTIPLGNSNLSFSMQDDEVQDVIRRATKGEIEVGALPTNQITQWSQHIRWRLVRLTFTWLWKTPVKFCNYGNQVPGLDYYYKDVFFLNPYCDQVIFNLYYNNLSITFNYFVIFIHHFGKDVLLLIRHTVVGSCLCSQ